MEIDFGSVRTFLFDVAFGSWVVGLTIYQVYLRAKIRLLEKELDWLRQKTNEKDEVVKSIAEIHQKLLDYFRMIFAN